MPSLIFVGDVHGQLTKLYESVMYCMERFNLKFDGIVQVGDLGVFRKGTDWSTMWHNRVPAPIPTWVIMGNHEEPGMIREWQVDPDRIQGMHLLPDGEITNVLGLNIGAVWGNYSPISWLNPSRVHENRQSGGSERIAMHVDRLAVERLITSKTPMDVFVTHDSATSTLPLQFRGKTMDPAIKGLLGLTSNEEAGGCQGFSEVLKLHKPDRYFFGHLHCFDEGIVGRTRYTCLNALGYDGGPWYSLYEF
jgi:hypothetical protein